MRQHNRTDRHDLDCLVIGGGPAGLSAALYLARFGRRFLLVDAGASRARWIPTSHNIPFFADGIGGSDILERGRQSLARYESQPLAGCVVALTRVANGFEASIDGADGGRVVRARRVLLATGSVDVEPALPDLPDAVHRGLVRYCPICDGWEARGRRVGVIGRGDCGLGEAVFLARTYTRDVTLLTLGEGMALTGAQHDTLRAHGIAAVEQPIASLRQEDGRIAAFCGGDGTEYRFDTIYSALGLVLRSDLARGLGAELDEDGAVIVRDHCRTSVDGLYAAGDVVRGLSQIAVGLGHGAVAATDVHNHCEDVLR